MAAGKVKPTYTITWGDRGENHVGMEIIGKRADSGFTLEELALAMKKFESEGVVCQWVDFSPLPHQGEEAAVLVIRGGVEHLSNVYEDDVLSEQEKLDYDTKYWDTRRSKVLNKQARHNVCFAEKGQESDFENKKGTIIPFDKVPLLEHIGKRLKRSEENTAELQ